MSDATKSRRSFLADIVAAVTGALVTGSLLMSRGASAETLGDCEDDCDGAVGMAKKYGGPKPPGPGTKYGGRPRPPVYGKKYGGPHRPPSPGKKYGGPSHKPGPFGL